MEKEKEEKKVKEPKKKLIAKRDFEIHFNAFHIIIKEGDDLKEIPKIFLDNLKTEKVI